MRKRNPLSGLFNGHWELVHDDEGRRKNVRIQRDEYPELYRLHRICTEYERRDAAGAGNPSIPSRWSGTPPQERHAAYMEPNPFHEH